MAQFILTYDLNGPFPAHDEVDRFIETLCPGARRILETVWLVPFAGGAVELREWFNGILRPEDRLLVARTDKLAFQNLLVDTHALEAAWHMGRAA